MLAQKMGRQIIPVVEKYTELELILEYAEKVGVRPQHRHARQAGRARLGPLAVVGRLPLEVRPDGHRDPARPRGARSSAAWQDCLKLLHFHLGSQITQHPHHQERAERGGPRLLRSGQATAPGWSSWTSAAGWASTTTVRRPTSSRASTTRCRNTPTTSSTTSRRCATKRACRTRPSSRRAAAPSSAYHSVLVFNVLGVERLRRGRRSPTTVPRRLRAAAASTCSRPITSVTAAQRAREPTTTRSRRSTWR